MKKALRIVSAALCVSLAFTGCSLSDIGKAVKSVVSDEGDNSLTKELFSKGFGYHMFVPESWNSRNDRIPSGSVGNGVDLLWTGSSKGDILLQVTTASSSYVGFDAYFSKLIQNTNDRFSLNLTRDDFEEKEFNGYKAWYVEADDAMYSPTRNLVAWMYCIDDEKGIIFVMSFAEPDSVNDETRELVESMVATIKKY